MLIISNIRHKLVNRHNRVVVGDIVAVFNNFNVIKVRRVNSLARNVAFMLGSSYLNKFLR